MAYMYAITGGKSDIALPLVVLAVPTTITAAPVRKEMGLRYVNRGGDKNPCACAIVPKYP